MLLLAINDKVLLRLVNTLRRDLLESFGEGRTSRKIMEDLVQLQQELQRLRGEDKKVLEELSLSVQQRMLFKNKEHIDYFS